MSENEHTEQSVLPHQIPPVFETERLILRPTNLPDAAFFLKLYNTPKWLRFIGDRNVHSIADVEDWIRMRIYPQYDRLGYGNFTIVLKINNTPIGACGLYDRSGVDGVDLGFALMPEYEGNGYAFEAASRIKTEALTRFALSKLSAVTVRENTSSQKLLEKLGFTFERLITLPGDEEEIMLYTVLLTHNLP